MIASKSNIQIENVILSPSLELLSANITLRRSSGLLPTIDHHTRLTLTTSRQLKMSFHNLKQDARRLTSHRRRFQLARHTLEGLISSQVELTQRSLKP